VIVVGGTSGLVAALNTSDPEHGAARTAMRQAALIVVSPLVILEIEHITTRNVDRKAAYAVNDWVLGQERSGRFAIPELSAGTLCKAHKVQNHYSALRLDLTDAVNVVLAEAYDTEIILTLDRRVFRAVTPLTGNHAFRLLPDDL
jgi:predicted nucleic acid-binding protein